MSVELAHDVVGGRAAQAQRGEPLAHLVAGAQRRGLLADDAAVHGLGERDELDLVVQGDQREPVLASRRLDDRRHVAVVHAEFEHETREPRLDEPGDEVHELGRVGRPTGTRRQQQLAAVQQTGDSGTVGNVHPPHPGIERSVIRQHLGHARGDRRKREDLADGGEAPVG